MKELGEFLIKHYGLHEGKFDLWLEYQVGFGNFGPKPDAVYPGAAMGISRIGLVPSKVDGPFTIDAAAVNPVKPKRSTRASSKSTSGKG